MQIARPVSGFKVIEKQAVYDTLAAAGASCPWLAFAYSNVRERLRMTGHKTGHAIKGNQSRRYFVECDPATNSTRMVVAYDVLGDELTIYAVKVLIGAANNPSTGAKPAA
jgi:hypothetical protein